MKEWVLLIVRWWWRPKRWRPDAKREYLLYEKLMTIEGHNVRLVEKATILLTPIYPLKVGFVFVARTDITHIYNERNRAVVANPLAEILVKHLVGDVYVNNPVIYLV